MCSHTYIYIYIYIYIHIYTYIYIYICGGLGFRVSRFQGFSVRGWGSGCRSSVLGLGLNHVSHHRNHKSLEAFELTAT